MSTLKDQAQPAVDHLLQNDEEQLYTELGIRLQALQTDPSVGGSFDPHVTYDAQHMGPMDDLREFGKRFFERINEQAYDVMCGTDDEDNELRQEVAAAFNIGEKAVAAALSALLVAHLGLAAAIAAVVATIIIRLFFRASHGAMCDVWKGKVPEPAS